MLSGCHSLRGAMGCLLEDTVLPDPEFAARLERHSFKIIVVK